MTNLFVIRVPFQPEEGTAKQFSFDEAILKQQCPEGHLLDFTSLQFQFHDTFCVVSCRIIRNQPPTNPDPAQVHG